MKSIERRFKQLAESQPHWSTLTCFSEAIEKQGFSNVIIARWFNQLVDKDDYQNSDKKAILKNLYDLTKNS